MPRDVAVHKPGTWVVSFETDDCVTLAGQHRGITTRWAGEVECADQGRVEGTLALAEERKVVAVQMHWVGCEKLVLDDEVDPLVGLGNDGHVLGGREGSVGGGIGGLGKLLKSWEAGVDVHGVAVQVPAEDSAIVGSGNSTELSTRESGSLGSEGTGRTGGLGDYRNKRCNGFVLADTCNVTWVEAGG